MNSRDYLLSSRPSISSMISVDSYQLSSPKLRDSLSTDGSGSMTPDGTSLTDSFNNAPTFNAISTDIPDDEDEASVSLVFNPKPLNSQTKVSKLSLLKDKTIPTTSLFDSFDSDLTRILHHLENSLTKYVLESGKSNKFVSSIDSQLADIRLMIDCEKDCSLLANQDKCQNGYLNDQIFRSVLNEFDMRVMLSLFNQYLKANANLSLEAGKNK